MASWLEKLTRFFKPGRLSERLKAQLETEGLLLLAEGVGVSVSYRRFKAPGKFFLYKRAYGVGSLALTSHRIIAQTYGRTIIDTPYDDPKFKAIAFALERKRLSASFDPSVFNPRQSGDVSIHFRLPDPAAAAVILERFGAELTRESR